MAILGEVARKGAAGMLTSGLRAVFAKVVSIPGRVSALERKIDGVVYEAQLGARLAALISEIKHRREEADSLMGLLVSMKLTPGALTDDLRDRISDVTNRLAEFDRDVRALWREKWPAVERVHQIV